PVAGSNGLGVTHICREWSQVYAYIEKNQRGSVWAEHKPEMQSLAVKSSRRISSRTIDEWDQLGKYVYTYL
ncbi:hypothetical protein P692DRAFT_20726987, partial [Suillus brevipes Sb2]